MGERGPGADPRAQLDRSAEVKLRFVWALDRRREDPEEPRDGADADLRIADGDPVGVWEQQLVERSCLFAFVEARSRVGEQAEADLPLLVEREPCEAF